MKRIVALLLSLLMVISMIPTAAFAAEEVTEPEAISAEEATAPETLPTEEVTEPETAPSEEVTEPEAVPTEEVTEPETLPTEEVTEPETEPAGEATEPETEEETQTPESRSGDTMSQEDFLTALEAAGNSYTLTQRVTVTSGVNLSCEVVIAEGGKLVVEEGASLVTSALLKVDGGQLQLGYGSTLATEGSGVVCVVSGSLYDGGTNLSLEGITPYIEQYPRGRISNMDSSHICYITDISSARDLSSALNSYGNYGSLRLHARSSISYRGQLTLPGNAVLYLRATDTATGSLVLEADSTLTLEGMIVLEGSGAKLNVEKTASLVNCGEIFVQADAVLRIRQGAALDNQGLVKVNEGGTFYGNGTLTGKDIDGTVSKEDTSVLEELKEGLSQGSYTLTKRLVLTESMTFNKTVTIAEGGSLVIPRGVTLYFNDDGGLIVDGGHFKVESGGKVSGGNYDTCSLTVNSGSFTILSGGEVSLNNTWAGYLRINGGDVTVYGGTVFNASEISMTLPTTARVNGIDPKQILTSGTFSTMEELRQLLSLGSAYRQLGVSLSSGVEDFTLESVTIPGNATLSFGNVSGEIRIPEGAVVENQGKLALTYSALRLQSGGKLLNKGLMDLYGGTVRVHSGSELVNTGTLRAEVSSMLHIQEGGLLDNPGSLFHTKDVLIYGQVAGNPPRLQGRDDIYTEFGREVTTPQGFGVALMEAQNSDADFYIYVRCQLEAEEDLTVPYNVHLVFLGENSGLTVKPGATVTLNCIAASFTGSDLTVQSGGTLVVNHSASIGGGGFLLAEEGSTLALSTDLYVDKGCAQVYGTVTGQGKVVERTGESQTDPVIVTSSSQLVSELANAAAWDDTYPIYIQSDLVLEQSVTVPENAALVVRYPGSRLCLAEGVSLTNDGSISVSSLASLSISRNAILIGNSLIRMNGCATMTVQEGGTLVVNMRIDQEKGCSITVYGTLDKLNGMVEGTVYYPNEREPLTQAQFQVLVSESNGSFTLDRPLTLNGFQFPENFRLTLAKGADLQMAGSFDGEMVVQNGAKLTLDGGSVNDGTITLHSGAELILEGNYDRVTNNGSISLLSGARMALMSNSTIDNQGELRIHSGSRVERYGEYASIVGKDPVYLAPEKDTGIQELDPLRQEDILNDDYYYVDISDGRFTADNFNLLYRAVRMAQEEGRELYVTVRNAMTVTADLHLPDKVYLYIQDGVRLSVAQGVTLSCAESAGIRVKNAELRVKSGGKLVTYDVELEENGILYVEKEGTLQAPGSIRAQSNGQVINWGTLDSSSVITLDPGSKGLTNYGSLTAGGTVYLRGGALLENRGTLTNQEVIRIEEGGQLKNAGELTNNGSLLGEKGSVFSNSGTLYNEGRLIFREGATAANTGKLTGAGDIEDQSGTLQNKDYAEFLNGVRSGWAEVRKTITVTEDLYIEDAVIFIEEGGNLVIPDGVTVTYDLLSEDTDNRILIYQGGKLTVEEGGTLVNNYNIMARSGSTVEVRGSYRFGENGMLWVQEGTVVQGLTRDQLGMQRHVYNAGQLYAALAEEGYRKRLLDISGNIDLTTSLTIGPENLVRMETYYQYLSITDGAVLTVDGDVDLRAGGFKVRNGGTLVLNGRVNNEENGVILVYPGGDLIVGGRLEGKSPVYVTEEALPQGETITQAELKALIAEQSPYLDLENKSVTVTADLNLSSLDYVDITGDAGICPVITVASGATLNLGDTPLLLNGSKLIIEPGAAVKLRDSSIYITQDSTLQVLAGGTLSAKGCYLSVDNFGSLVVEKEANLILGENDYVGVSPLARVTGVAKCNQVLQDAAVSSTRELKHCLDTFSDCRRMELYVSFPFTLTEDVTLPENVYLQLDTWYECIPQMTVAPGVTFTAEGDIEIQGVGAELNVEGTLINRGDFTSVWENGALNILGGGTMINETNMQIAEKGIVTVCEGGTLDNRGYIDTYGDGQMIVNGTFTGNQPGYTPEIIQWLAANQEELAAILEEAAASSDVYEVYVNRDMQLTQSLVIPGNTTLTLVEGITTLSQGAELVCEGVLSVYTAELVVEADSRLTVNQTLLVSEGGSLWVKAGADLENNGQILCDAISWLLMDGTFINLGTVEGQFIPSDQRAVPVYSWKELQEALESGAPSIDVMADLTVSKDLTIQNTLRIPQGVTVTVRSGAALDVQGTVAVYGTLKINGQTQGNRIEAYGGTVTGPQGSWRTEGQLAQEIRFACNTTMGLGMQQSLNAWVYPADAWDIGVSYEILEGGEYAILEDGLLTSTGVGEVTIRATSADGNAFADITLRILDYSVVIDETRSVSRLTEGSKGQIYADLVPGNLTDTEILFSLAEGDEEYAKLSAKNGVATLTAKSLEDGHTVTVLAESKDGQALAAEWKVTLVPKAQSVVILDEAGEPIASGATVTYDLRNQDNLAADCLIFDATTLPDASLGEVSWSCSDTRGKLVTNVDLSVPNRIRLEGFTGKTGTLTLTAAAADGSGKKANVKLKLVALPQNIVLAESVKDWLLSGKTMTLKAVDADTGKELSSSALGWSLVREQDEAYVTLTPNGKLTARKLAQQQTVEVVGYVLGNEEIAWVSFPVTIYPATTQVSILYETEGWTEDITGTTLFLEAAEESIDLDPWLYPTGELGAMQAVTWKSSNKAVATVDEDGIVTGTGKTGNVTITATAADGSGRKATVKLKYGIMTRDIDLLLGKEPFDNTENTLALRSGQSISITGRTVPEKPTTRGVTFFLENPADGDCLQVSSSGKLTAKTVFMPRSVNVVARSKDGGAFEVITVRVLPKEERQLLLLDGEETNLTRSTKVVQKLDTVTLTAKLLDTSDPENISLEETEVTWRSSNERIAKLSGTNGSTVTAELLRSGSATITATTADGTKTTVTVKAVDRLADSIRITDKAGNEILVVASGKSLNLAAQVLDREGGPASNKNVTWQVLWGEVKISSSGKLTATSGLAQCSVALVEATARDGSGVTQRVNVVIVPLTQSISLFREDAEVTNLTLTLAPGDTLELSAETFPTLEIPEGEALRTVTWRSSAKKVAEIDSVTGELTALTPGTTTVTATATDGSGKKATVKIRVE